MSAAELATVVEGWATLAGLMVVTAGAVFAGAQLEMGVVGEDEIFPDVGLSRGAIEAWERLKHLYRGSDQMQGRFLPETSGIRHERLAARAQAWLLRRGVQELGSVPHFDADRDALAAMGREVAAARAAASGAPPTRVA